MSSTVPENAPEKSDGLRRVAREADVPEGRPFGATADGVELVLVRTPSGALRAFGGRCPHQGTLLSEGEIAGGALICRAHGWRFDLETGEQRSAAEARCLERHRCEVRGGDVYVEIGSSSVQVRPMRATRTLDDLPAAPALPVLGNLLDLDMRRVHAALERWGHEHGRLYTFRLGPLRFLAVSDPELTEDILRQRPGAYRRGAVESIFAEMGISGVFSAEGEAWRRQRRLAMEALSNRHLRGFFPSLLRVAERLRARWLEAADSRREIDIQEDFMRFTVDVTTSLAFGVDMNTTEQGDDVIQRHLSQVFPAINRRIFSPLPYWRYVKLPADRVLDRALLEIHSLLDGLIGRTRARIEGLPESERKPTNFLEAMILARDDDGRPFPDDIIAGNALTMLLAGEDTTANSLTWIVHLLCERPDVVARIRAEVENELGDRSMPSDPDEAGRLVYVDAVGQEAARMRPVAPVGHVEANEDVVIGDVAVPKGTPIVVLFRVPCMQSRYFGYPTRFEPERWIQPLAVDASGCPAHTPSALMPFGSGPRICPGRTLALTEIRLVTAMLYSTFDVERVGDPNEVTEALAFTMEAEKLRVRLGRRAPGR